MTEATARPLLIAGALLAGSAVAFGAFGSHALESMTSPERIDTWQTAVRYQMFHALALLALGALATARPEMKLMAAALCFILGSLVFSGSLYLLVLLDYPPLGAITPLGGLLYLAGWTALVYHLWQPQPR